MSKLKRFAIALSLCLAVTSGLTACGDATKKLSMGEMAKTASSFETYESEISVHAENDTSTIDVAAITQTDNFNIEAKNIAFSFAETEPIPAEGGTVSPEIVNLDFNDAVKMVDGNIYINLPAMMTSVENAINDMGETEENVTLDKELLDFTWISIPGNVYNDTAKSAAKDFSDTLVDGFENIIKSSETEIKKSGENGYIVSISDSDALKKVLNTAVSEMEANKDSYVSKYEAVVETIDQEKLFAEYEETLINVVKAVCDKMKITYTEEYLEEMRNEFNSGLETATKESMMEEVDTAYDEFIASIKEMIDGIQENDVEITATYEIFLDGKEGERVCTQSLSFDGSSEDDTMNIDIKVKTAENEEKITAPEDAKTLDEAVSNIFDVLTESGLITEDTLSMFEGMSLSDLGSSSLMMGEEMESYNSEFDGTVVYEEDFDEELFEQHDIKPIITN